MLEENDVWGTSPLYGPYVDSTNRPMLLADIMECAPTPEHRWRRFQAGWPACDGVPDWLTAEILFMLCFDEHRGVEFLEGDDKEFFDALPEHVTVYRGCSPDRIKAMAWTTDIQIAEAFARGHRGIRVPDGAVYKATIGKVDILTVFTDRQESEIIVGPHRLTNIEQI